jgi:hypothetical protein
MTRREKLPTRLTPMGSPRIPVRINHCQKPTRPSMLVRLLPR